LAATVADINTLARSLLGDVAQDVYTDAVLLEYIKTAYREMERLMRSAGVSVFRKTSSALTVTSGTVTLTTATTPALPSDLLRPLEIMERVSGTGTYVRMSQSYGVLEDRAATALIQEWDWKNNALFFPAASGDVQIKIEYEAELAALTNSASALLIPNCMDGVAYLTCAYAVRARGMQEYADWFDKKAQECIKQLIASELANRRALTGRFGPQDGISTAETVQSLIRRVQALVNTGDKPSLSDTDILPFVQLAYKDVARSLRVKGCLILVKKQTYAALTNSTTSLTTSSSPALPSDLLRPLFMRERNVVINPTQYSDMQTAGKSGVEGTVSGVTDTYRGYWQWRDKTIFFPATGNEPGSGTPYDTDIELYYEATLSELTSPQSAILIPDATTAIVFLASAYVGISRGGPPDPVACKQQASELIDQLVAGDVAARQVKGAQFGALTTIQ